MNYLFWLLKQSWHKVAKYKYKKPCKIDQLDQTSDLKSLYIVTHELNVPQEESTSHGCLLRSTTLHSSEAMGWDKQVTWTSKT